MADLNIHSSFWLVEAGWNQVGDFLLLLLTLLSAHCLYQILESCELLRTQLLNHSREQVLDGLRLWIADDNECVALQ